MIGKQINADAERFMRLKSPRRHLTMLQRVGDRARDERVKPLQFIERDFRAFIAICMHMHLNTGLSKGFEIVAQRSGSIYQSPLGAPL